MQEDLELANAFREARIAGHGGADPREPVAERLDAGSASRALRLHDPVDLVPADRKLVNEQHADVDAKRRILVGRNEQVLQARSSHGRAAVS